MQQDEDLCIVENDGRRGLISDLLATEDGMQKNQVPISDCNKVKLAILDIDSDCDDEEYVVPDPIREISIVEITSKEENKFIDPSVLIPSEQNLQKEVIQPLCEKQDEIFVKLSEKYSLDNSAVNDINVSFEVYEQSEVFPLMINECDEKHDNLVAMSYEYDQQCIQIAEDRSIEDCHSYFSSHVSCFEIFFQEEIFSPTFSEFFEDQEHTLVEVHYEERLDSR